MFKKLFEGTVTQIRFIFRKDWLSSAIWIFSFIAIVVFAALAYDNYFSSPDDIANMMTMFGNPAMVALLGPVEINGTPTISNVFAANFLLLGISAIIIMNILFVIRNTRDDEEKGHQELLRALPVGRLSNLSSTLISITLVNFVLFLLSSGVLLLLGFFIPAFSIQGSFLFGAAVGIIGIVFASASAIICQLFSDARTAMIVSFFFFLFTYFLRAIGDVQIPILSFFSPLGIILKISCFAQNNWWPVLTLIVLTLVLATIALCFNAIRDGNQGLIILKKQAKSSKLLTNHFTLALRLLRPTLLSWAIGLVLIGGVYGSVMGSLEEFINDNEFLKKILVPPEGHTYVEMYITMIIMILSVASSIPAVGIIARLANEEKARRYENIISKKLSRFQILAHYSLISFISSFLFLFLTMLGLWSSSILMMEEPISFFSMFSSTMIYLPAVLIIVSISIFLLGVLPKKVPTIIYSYLGFSFLILYMGKILSFPEWTKYLTPFGFIPQLPIDKISFCPIFVLLVLAGSLTSAGFVLYRKRDLI